MEFCSRIGDKVLDLDSDDSARFVWFSRANANATGTGGPSVAIREEFVGILFIGQSTATYDGCALTSSSSDSLSGVNLARLLF